MKKYQIFYIIILISVLVVCGYGLTNKPKIVVVNFEKNAVSQSEVDSIQTLVVLELKKKLEVQEVTLSQYPKDKVMNQLLKKYRAKYVMVGLLVKVDNQFLFSVKVKTKGTKSTFKTIGTEDRSQLKNQAVKTASSMIG